MLTKINYITNLQDARSCAAWGINFLSFCFERGSDYKIPENMALDIASWIDGPILTADFGTDFESLQSFFHNHSNLPFAIQFNGRCFEEAKYFLPQEFIINPNRVFIIKIDNIFTHLSETIQLWDKYLIHRDNVFYEIDIDLQIIPVVKDFLVNNSNINLLFNLDPEIVGLREFHEKISSLSEIQAENIGISARKLIEEDFMNLDYDKIEALLMSIQEFAD